MKLVLRDIAKSFDKKKVLRDASFAFEKGNIYGLLGRNGAGKTTLFNCINEDLKIDGGSVFLEENGVEKAVCPDDIGYVLSTPVVPEFLTGREFLKFFIDINVKKIADVKPIDEYFDFVKIESEDRDRLLKDYSHGMKTKMQMLVSFIANPAILLLDEPLTSFDVVVADEMKKLLRQMKKDHIIIFSTHIMELALDLCDEIVILNGGVLEEIEREALDNAAFKDKIISALRGDENA
ncbi:MAG TPA: ABC transporter ATP-binding protein [Desulfitobacteriaceae bacterium]|jgi:ABC-2 type transport system ATP-binding protein|nr:ABC transporter ATP-binding protein [Desulfitobacteriaceae bacterium]